MNRLTAVRGECGDRMKKGEGISQRTYMHDLWTWTIVWGFPEGAAGWKWANEEKVRAIAIV